MAIGNRTSCPQLLLKTLKSIRLFIEAAIGIAEDSYGYTSPGNPGTRNQRCKRCKTEKLRKLNNWKNCRTMLSE